jgi:hypothetical protein
MTKGQTTIYKTPHRKLKIEQRDPHWGEHRKGSRCSIFSFLVCPLVIVLSVLRFTLNEQSYYRPWAEIAYRAPPPHYFCLSF